MKANEFKENGIDETLRKMLSEHREKVSEAFWARVMKRVEAEEKRKMLAGAVWAERLTLGGVVASLGSFLGLMWLFPDLMDRFGKLSSQLGNAVSTAQEGLAGALLLGGVLGTLLVYTLYHLVYLLVLED